MKTLLTLLTLLFCYSSQSYSQEISSISSFQDYHTLVVKFKNEREPLCGGYSARGVIYFKYNNELINCPVSFDRVPGDHFELFDDEPIEIEGEFISKVCTDGNKHYVFHAVSLKPINIRQRKLILPESLKSNELIEPEHIKR